MKKWLGSGLFSLSVQDFVWNSLSLMSSRVLQYLALPIIAKMLSPSEFVKYDLFLTYSTFLVVITSLGMDSGLGLVISNHGSSKSKQFLTFGLLLICCLYIPLFILSFFIQWGISVYIQVAIVGYGLILSGQSLLLGYNKWKGNIKQNAIIVFVFSFLGYVLGYSLLYMTAKPQIESFIFGIAFGSFLGFSLNMLISRKDFAFERLSLSEIKYFLSVSTPFVGASAAIQGRKIFERMLIAHHFSPLDAGRYLFNVRIIQVFEIFFQMVGNSFFPRILLNIKKDEGKQLHHTLLIFTLCFSVLSIIVVFFFQEQIINILGGQIYFVKNLLPLIVLYAILYSFNYISGYGFFVLSNTKIYAAILGLCLLLYGLAFRIDFLTDSLLVFAKWTLFCGSCFALIYFFVSEMLFKTIQRPYYFIFIFAGLSFLLIFLL